MLALASCTSSGTGKPAAAADPSTHSASASAAPLPAPIKAIFDKPEYAKAMWSVLAVDLTTGRTVASSAADALAYTGSTRKLFSVGLALKTLGADHRTTTSVYRRGTVDKSGVLHGNLVFVGAGDLTLGGRRTKNDMIQFTDFDHNDANNLGTAELTPQDPLTALKNLAAQVRASGIKKVDGNVVVDDRLFPAYRVPNQQLLITPTMLNEDKVDVTVTPTEPGKPAHITYRPKVPGFRLVGTVRTTAKGTDPTVAPAPGTLPNGEKLPGLINCFGHPGCTGHISGTIPVGYHAPLSGDHEYVGVFRIDTPENLARSALMSALQRRGVRVGAPAVTTNPVSLLPKSATYPRGTRVAAYTSAPYAQEARLILKVSLNLGANLALTKFGLAHGVHTLKGALALERRTLVSMGVPGNSFAFPTNGSGSPDSKASPRGLVAMLTAMSHTPVAAAYRTGLPLLGVDGSLTTIGTHLPARGHVWGKTGTTVERGALVAQTLAGYIDARNGHRIAYAIILNNLSPLKGFDQIIGVLQDQAAITDVLYRSS